jgi:hypothetical protein
VGRSRASEFGRTEFLRWCTDRNCTAPVSYHQITGLAPRRGQIAEMPRDSGKITRRCLDSSVFLDQNPYGVTNLFVGMYRGEKKPQAGCSFGDCRI